MAAGLKREAKIANLGNGSHRVQKQSVSMPALPDAARHSLAVCTGTKTPRVDPAVEVTRRKGGAKSTARLWQKCSKSNRSQLMLESVLVKYLMVCYLVRSHREPPGPLLMRQSHVLQSFLSGEGEVVLTDGT